MTLRSHRESWRTLAALCVVAAAVATAALLEWDDWPVHAALCTGFLIGLAMCGASPGHVASRLARFWRLFLLLGAGLVASAGVSDGGPFAATIALRTVTSFLAGLWFIHVCPIWQLVRTARDWGMPASLERLAHTTQRLCYVLWNTLERRERARQSRSIVAIGWRAAGRNAMEDVGMLAVQAFSRADQVAFALRARTLAANPGDSE